MRKLTLILCAFLCVTALLLQATAQPPGAKEKKDYSNSTIVTAIMAFDKNKTGKVTKEQVTDQRLHRLFDQADVNKKGVVTREEVIALATKLETEFAKEGGGVGFGGPGKGKDGKGKGPKSKGGPGGQAEKGTQGTTPKPDATLVTIKGRVVDKDNNGRAGTRVQLTDATGAIKGEQRTEEDGVFAFEKVPAGVYTIEARISIPALKGATKVEIPADGKAPEFIQLVLKR
jgi:hypothetical protein